MDFEERTRAFNNMMEKLIEIAEADGVITSAEAALLKNVQLSVDEYNEAIKLALQDEVITDSEYLELRHIEDNLLLKTFALIEQDQKLDHDNKKLVEILFDTLMKVL